MALFKRAPDRPEPPGATGPEATYARMIDGEHLWLAVRGEGPLLLRRPGADDVPLPADPAADAHGPLLSTLFPLAKMLADETADELELRLFAGDQPVRPGAPPKPGPGLAEPPTRDRRWQFRVTSEDDQVVVRRQALPRTVVALAFAATDDAVEILLDTETDRAELVVDGTPIAELPVDDSVLRLETLPILAPGTSAVFRVRDLDVVRFFNALERPMAAVALPPLPEADVSLRWTPEARLAVRREEAS